MVVSSFKNRFLWFYIEKDKEGFFFCWIGSDLFLNKLCGFDWLGLGFMFLEFGVGSIYLNCRN